jgi:hypothetical protein
MDIAGELKQKGISISGLTKNLKNKTGKNT